MPRFDRGARAAITSLTGPPPLCPDRPAWYVQMVSLLLPVVDAVGTQRRLYAEFGIEVPVMARDGRNPLRVSVQGYNPGADVDALISALTSLLA